MNIVNSDENIINPSSTKIIQVKIAKVLFCCGV